MKRAMKLWSILLVLVMVLCMMPARILNAQADEIVWTKVGKGTKVLDLNGHRLYLSDQGNAPAQSVMMVIPEGASLNVYDDVGTGMIWMDGQMKFGNDFYGDDAILVRDVFAVTGGLLAVHGGEIHAGRTKRVWCNFVSQNTPDWDWGDKYSAASAYCGYATKFNSGTAVTVESGEARIYGGELWGRGWDNISIISRVPNNGAGADGHRDRCAAMRVLGDGKARIYDGSFYGRSDADAIQVEIPSNVTIEEGLFNISTNDWLVTPLIGPILVLLPSNVSSGDRLMTQQFDVLGSGENNFGVTFLWRAMGSPEPESAENPFVDVKTTDFFYKSVLWAVEKGITNGVDATHFGPASPCNRAQVVTFLYRAYN